MVALQRGGDADGSVHAQGVFLQAAGGRRVIKHWPGRHGSRRRCMPWASGKATSSGVGSTEGCWPGHPVAAPSRKVWKGSSWLTPGSRILTSAGGGCGSPSARWPSPWLLSHRWSFPASCEERQAVRTVSLGQPRALPGREEEQRGGPMPSSQETGKPGLAGLDAQVEAGLKVRVSDTLREQCHWRVREPWRLDGSTEQLTPGSAGSC